LPHLCLQTRVSWADLQLDGAELWASTGLGGLLTCLEGRELLEWWAQGAKCSWGLHVHANSIRNVHQLLTRALC
jgi:hypothetical protein